MATAATLSQSISLAREDPGNTLTFLPQTGEPLTVSYAQLGEDSGRRAARLASLGIGPGNRVAMMLRSDLQFVEVFWALLAAGAVPVPLYPPTSLKRIDHYFKNLESLLQVCDVRAIICLDKVARILRHIRATRPVSFEILTPDALDGGGETLFATPDPTAPAFIQCTSGSSGVPKAVVISNRNVVANIQALRAQANDDVETDKVCSWIPMFHDMGLLSMLRPLYFGYPQVFMEPQTFLRQPIRWLQAVSDYRGTIAAVPNFSLELCLRKVKPEQCGTLDLSSMRLLYNGSEPIRVEIVERFLEVYGRYGFERKAMYPCYGMSESTLAATLPIPGETRLDCRFDRKALERDGRARLVDPASVDAAQGGDAPAVAIAGVGIAPPEHEVRVLAPDRSVEAEEGQVGRIIVTGPSISDEGYLNNPEATQRAFGPHLEGDPRRWFDTCDLGFMLDDHLFIVGRADDMLIVRGRNVYPSAIEGCVESAPEVRGGCSVAIQLRDAPGSPATLVVIAEASQDSHGSELKRRIHNRVKADLGVEIDEICLIAPGTLLKTSSGKVCRKANRDALLGGRLVERSPPQWLALARFQLRLFRERAKAFLTPSGGQ